MKARYMLFGLLSTALVSVAFTKSTINVESALVRPYDETAMPKDITQKFLEACPSGTKTVYQFKPEQLVPDEDQAFIDMRFTCTDKVGRYVVKVPQGVVGTADCECPHNEDRVSGVDQALATVRTTLSSIWGSLWQPTASSDSSTLVSAAKKND